MNNPSPLMPQGTLLEQKNRSRSRMRTAFLFIAGVHVIGLVTLLTMQGCKREQAPVEPTTSETNSTPPFDAGTNAPMDTNAYVPPVMETNVPPQAPPAPPVPSTSEYTIVKGDSFYTIGKKFGVTTKAIQEANPGVDSTKLKIGQKITVPAASSASPAATTSAVASPETGEQVYAVKSGDTLTSIAKAHGVTVKALRSENSLTTDRIKVGQKLKIPGKAATTEAAPAPVPTPEPAPAAPAPAPATTPMH